MQVFLKTVLALFLLGLILLFGLLLIIPRWLPSLLSEQAQIFLQGQGFSPAQVRVSSLSFHQLEVRDLELGQAGVELTVDEIGLTYNLSDLRKGKLDALKVDQVQLTLNVPVLWESLVKETSQDAPQSGPRFDELLFPLNQVSINEVVMTLLDHEWKRSFQLDAQLFRSDEAQADYWIQLQHESDTVTLDGNLNVASPSTDARFRIDLPRPLRWFELPPSLPWTLSPRDYVTEWGPTTIEGALRYSLDDGLQRWAILAALANLALQYPIGKLDAGLINLGASGTGIVPEQLWGNIVDVRLTQTGTNNQAHFERLTLRNGGSEALALDTGDWQGDFIYPVYGFDHLRVSSGPVGVRVHGSWPTLIEGSHIRDFVIKGHSPESKFSLEAHPTNLTALLQWDATFKTEDFAFGMNATFRDLWLLYGAQTISADTLTVHAEGQLPDKATLSLSVENGHASWAQGSGNLSGINGTIKLNSLLPPALPHPQKLHFSTLSQGDVSISDGTVVFDYQPRNGDQSAILTVTLGGNFAEGSIKGQIEFHFQNPIRADASLLMENLSLEVLASYFPQFQGQLKGRVSGQLPIRLDGSSLILLPGYLEMANGETGHFRFTRQGWLTQDPSLNPEDYVASKDLLTLMNEPNGAAILTEFAMRDLNMTAFRLDILPLNRGARRASIHLEGDSNIHGVNIPIINDINFGEDLKEALNLLLNLQNKIHF